MNGHENHRYHPYAPPANLRSERYFDRELLSQDNAKCANGSTGMTDDRFVHEHRSGRILSGSVDEKGIHHCSGVFRTAAPWEGNWKHRCKPPQLGPSPQWYQDFSSRSSTKELSSSDGTSQNGRAPVMFRDVHTNTTCSFPVQSVDNKDCASSEAKNPSIVKIAPFSHQPLSNSPKPATSSSPSLTSNSSRETSLHVKPGSEILNCSQVATVSSSRVEHEGQALVTFLSPTGDGQFRRIVTKTICSCQLRHHASKYADKGKSNNDPIVIDSDEEGEKSDGQDSNPSTEDGKNSSTSSAACAGKTSHQDKELSHISPRKRAKMSTDSGSTVSLILQNRNLANITTDMSGQVTESVAEMACKVAGKLHQNWNEGSSSYTPSSDSLSSVASNYITEEAPLLANPQILREMLKECDQTVRFPKKFKVSPRNLFTAAKSCNIHKVLSLLVEGCDPNLQVGSAKGKTAMHAAASGGYVDIINCLRLAGGDLNLMDYENRTPLFDAVTNHKVKAVEYLIECGAVLTGKDIHGMTCFHLATRQGHIDLISLLLKTRMFDVNQKDDGGWTPIMWAAEARHTDATRLLIEKGANVHIRDLELNVPLHWAALSGNLEVSKLLLDEHTDINSLNKREDTPLHIATREDNYACVQLLISRGADIHIKNKEGFTPGQIALADSRIHHLLESKRILESCQGTIRPHILHSDISRGQENVSIPCVNEVDDEPFPVFHFVKECCEINGGTVNRSINKVQGCRCEGSCRSGKACSCSGRSDGQRIWFSESGLLVGEIQKFDRPLLYECNRMCNCWTYCKNRVVQNGMQYPLQLYRTADKGWGVRSLTTIPQGSFVCEYTGELISDMEADTRDDDSYLFDLDCKESCDELYCMDAKNYGNISRFINHSCEPNIFPIRVFIDHRDIRFPRIAFFASEEINLHDEICFDYGDRFWSVKKKEFFCKCGTPSCKYGKRNS